MSRPPMPADGCLGHAAVDYLLVVALVAIAFALGRDGAIEPLLGAIAEHYRRFTWALALP